MSSYHEIEAKPGGEKLKLSCVLAIAGTEAALPGVKMKAPGATTPEKTSSASGIVNLEYFKASSSVSILVESPITTDDAEESLEVVCAVGEPGDQKVVFAVVPKGAAPQPDGQEKRRDHHHHNGRTEVRVEGGDGADFERRIDRAIERVFGRRVGSDDAGKLLDELEASFDIDSGGAVVKKSGLATLTVGQAVGAQARLVAKTNRSLEVIKPLLGDLRPLTPQFDDEDGDAEVALFEIEAEELRAELSQPSGISRRRVDRLLGDSDDQGVLATIVDRIGAKFGIEAKNVVTIEDDRICSAYATIKGELEDITGSWETYKALAKPDLATTIATINQLSDILVEDVAVLRERLLRAGIDEPTIEALDVDDANPPARLGGYLRWLERSPAKWQQLMERAGNRGLAEVEGDVEVVLGVATDLQAFLSAQDWGDDITDAIDEVVASIERIKGEF